MSYGVPRVSYGVQASQHERTPSSPRHACRCQRVQAGVHLLLTALETHLFQQCKHICSSVGCLLVPTSTGGHASPYDPLGVSYLGTPYDTPRVRVQAGMHLLSDFSTNNKNTAGGVSKIAADDTSHRLHRGKPQHFDKHDRHTHDCAVSQDISLPPAYPPLPASRHALPPLPRPVFPVDLRIECPRRLLHR